MHPVEWTEEISTGTEQVDDDHKILLALLNRCINAVGSNVQGEDIGAILEELLKYTDYHLRREEVIMAACNCSGLRGH